MVSTKKAARLILLGAAAAALPCASSRAERRRTLSSSITSPATRVDLPLAYIVGGEAAAPADTYTQSYGFSVGQYLCGGTLIHDDIFLTAAHCEGVFLDGIFLGGTKIDGSESEEIMIAEEFPHEDFEEEAYENDIMVVKLAWTPEEDFTLQSLNIDPALPNTGKSCKAIGYGYTSEFGTVSPILREVDLDVVSHGTCDSFYGTIVEESMLCTFTEGKDTCLGDSGGPLLDKEGVQVAITSFGRGCARKGSPGVYTRVASYTVWIESMICTHSDVPPERCSLANGEPSESKVADASETPSASPTQSATPQPVRTFETAEVGDPPTAEESEEGDDDDHKSIRESLLSHCNNLKSDTSSITNMVQRNFCTFFHIAGGR